MSAQSQLRQAIRLLADWHHRSKTPFPPWWDGKSLPAKVLQTVKAAQRKAYHQWKGIK